MLGVAAGKETKGKAAEGSGRVMMPFVMQRSIMYAREEGDLKKATQLEQLTALLRAIEEGGDINKTDKQGMTALMLACQLRSEDAILWLMAKGADYKLKDAQGKTAHDYLEETGSFYNNDFFDIVDFMESPLTEREKAHPRSYSREEAKKIFREGDLITVAIMIRDKADIKTAIMDSELSSWYCRQREEKISLAVRHGLNLAEDMPADNLYALGRDYFLQALSLGMIPDIHKLPPDQQLDLAIATDDAHGVRRALRKDPSLLNNDTFLHKITSLPILQQFLKAGLDVKDKPLWGSGEIRKALIEAGANPNLRDEKDNSTEMHTAASILDLDYLRFLISKNLTVHAMRKDLDRPIHVALNYMDLRIPHITAKRKAFVEELLNAGVKVNTRGDSGYSPLYLACRLGMADLVKLMLAKGADPNLPAKDGSTPLHALLCVWEQYTGANPRTRQEEIVRMLIDAGANINAKRKVDPKDKEGTYTALEDAVKGNQIGGFSETAKLERPEAQSLLAAVKILLEKGAKVPEDILLDIRGDLPFDITEKLALLLLDHGASPTATSKRGQTTLMTAGHAGGRIAQQLIDAGVDVNAGQEGGEGPALALDCWNPMVASAAQVMLKAGAKLPDDIFDQMLGQFESPHYSSREPDISYYKKLVDVFKAAGADVTHSLLIKQRGRTKEKPLTVLLEAGADPNVRDKNGMTPLMTSMDATLLLKHGANVNARDNAGRTPLMHANDSEKIRMLIDAGADVNAVDKNGKSALFYAKDPMSVKLLLAAGANARHADNNGNTPLMDLCASKDNPDAALFLINAGTSIDAVNKEKKSAYMLAEARKHEKMMKLLERFGVQPSKSALVNARDDQGRTKLMLALADPNASLDSVKQLIDDGADVNAQDQKGKNPLMYARNSEQVKLLLERKANARQQDKEQSDALLLMVIERDDPESVKLLINAGADPFAMNKWKRNARMLATEYKRDQSIALLAGKGALNPAGQTLLMRTLATRNVPIDYVKQLIDDGADVNAQDKEGKTPLMYARNAEQIKLLLEKGADAKHLDKNGSSVLLLMVIERDDPESVKLLLDAGTNPAAVNKWKRTAHFLAIEYKREQTLKIFAERGITQ